MNRPILRNSIALTVISLPASQAEAGVNLSQGGQLGLVREQPPFYSCSGRERGSFSMRSSFFFLFLFFFFFCPCPPLVSLSSTFFYPSSSFFSPSLLLSFAAMGINIDLTPGTLWSGVGAVIVIQTVYFVRFCLEHFVKYK